MSILVSPGVQVQELDFTNVVPAVSTSIGGYAGSFRWGPVEEIRTVSSEKELALTFGAPDASTARSFLTAASYLKYSSNLKVSRALNASSKNATSAGSGLLIKNATSYENDIDLGGSGASVWAARCPGALGNSIAVEICTAGDAFDGTSGQPAWAYSGLFNSAPGTSASAASVGATLDEVHVVVIDSLGHFSGTAGTVLERFAFLSLASDAVAVDGTSQYYQTAINARSNYIWWLNHPSELNATTGTLGAGDAIETDAVYTTSDTALDYTLANGVDVAVTAGNTVTALAVFNDAETVDVNLVFTAGDATGSHTVADAVIALAELRRDIVGFISAPVETSLGASPAAAVITYFNQVAGSSYIVKDSTAVKMYDKYNDSYSWITAAGHIAGLCARTDTVADAWFSPAGSTRGLLLGVTKLGYNPIAADRDALYKLGINPIVSFPGTGPMLYGDKTAQVKPSAFDRINVRRLFLVLEKAIGLAGKAQLFELNDEFTRASFRGAVEPYLRDVKGRRGITDFRVVCDSSNNTGDIIDRNEFRADIYVKPAHAINFITLSFIATRTGVSFSEVVGTGSSGTPNL
jgi:phage tail sheath protein FI